MLATTIRFVFPTDKNYRKSSGLSNFFGFLGQQSQMNKPLIFDATGLGILMIVGTDTFPVASVRGSSRELEFIIPLGMD